MSIRRLAIALAALSLLTLVSGSLAFAAGAPPAKDKVIVYYFHETIRCSTCIKFEDYSKATLDTYFPKDLKNGTIEWHVLNMDAPQNKHFVKEFKLFTKALIIEKVHDGKVVAWKNLEDIWSFTESEPKFMNYVKTNIDAYL
jgi:hypothetical protein